MKTIKYILLVLLMIFLSFHYCSRMNGKAEELIKLKKAMTSQNIQPHLVSMAPATNQNQPQTPDTKTLGVEITSPMVGTFYLAPSPGAKSYVEIGDVIKPGDVVCIIEAMKLMNEIKAEIGGKVVRIQVKNGQPVEFGQKLFEVEPL